MSDTKTLMKKSVGNSHPEKTHSPVKQVQQVAAPSSGAVVARTIYVQHPPPTQVPCATPFQAYGSNVSTTVMDATAEITRGFGPPFIGNLSASPPAGMDWAYDFTDPLPCGVPLALVVRGTANGGTREETVVPFECEC